MSSYEILIVVLTIIAIIVSLLIEHKKMTVLTTNKHGH